MLWVATFYLFGSFSPRDWIYDVRQILEDYYSFDLRCSTDFGFMIWGSLSLYYHTCSLLSHNPPSIFTLYASPVDSYGGYAWVATFYLFGSFSPRDWIGLGFRPHTTLLFSSIITSSVYLHSLRFAGLFSRRLCLGGHFLPLWFFLSERLDLRCSTDIGRIIIRSNYDVRQILVL
jgi:hypothetical protein